MATVPVYLYEVFAARRFGGNLAGVVLLPWPAPPRWMQGVAADLGAPTTGFVELLAARQGRGEAVVRFFTPRQEIGACGHATVAVATALWETGAWSSGEGRVTAAGRRYPLGLRERDGGGVRVELRQRLLHTAQVADAELPGLRRVLGAAARSGRLPPVRAGTGLRHLLVAVETAAELAKLPMVAADIAALSRTADVDTIGIFALADDEPDGVRVRMRDLCAGIGAVEEPASGTTTATLGLVLAYAGVLTPEQPRLCLEMGAELDRPSQLAVTIDFVAGEPTVARLLGLADRTLSGELAAAADEHPEHWHGNRHQNRHRVARRTRWAAHVRRRPSAASTSASGTNGTST